MDDRTGYQTYKTLLLSLPFRLNPDIEDALVRLENQMYGPNHRHRTALSDRYMVEQYVRDQVEQAKREALAVAETYIRQLEDSVAALLKDRGGC